MNIFDVKYGGDALPDVGPTWSAFQDRWSRRLREEFPALRHIPGKRWQVALERRGLMCRGRDEIEPDHVVAYPLAAGERTLRVLLVTDAKFRATLRRADVEVVLDYAIALRAEEGCRIYIPKNCHIEDAAMAVEHGEYEILIHRDTLAREADIDPEFPDL